MRELNDFSKLCVHTMTTKPWSLNDAVSNYSKAGIKGITVWRNVLDDISLTEADDMIKSSGLEVVSLCRGGFFPYNNQKQRQFNIDDNRKAIEQAHAIGAPLVVLVVGAEPSLSLEENRKQIQEGIERVLPDAEAVGVKLAIEPLHPMYADDRSAVNTLKQANDMCEAINSPFVGVAADVYHLWWDSNLEQEIKRCGKSGHLLAFHVCDWKTPTNHMLTDRGLMGEGCINIRKIREWVEEAGFEGYNEVEIFSDIYWEIDQLEYLSRIKEAYLKHA